MLRPMSDNRLPVFDRTMFDSLLADIGADRMSRMLALFRGENDKGMQSLATAFAAGDLAAIAHHAHQLRNPAASLGFSHFAADLLLTELSANHLNDDAARPDAAQWHRLQEGHAAMVPALDALCAEFSTDIK